MIILKIKQMNLKSDYMLILQKKIKKINEIIKINKDKRSKRTYKMYKTGEK